jgi:hypothetical protein
MFIGRKITRWRGQVADQQWYYESGSPVTRDREMPGLTGVEKNPLFDDTLYDARADRSKLTEIMKVIRHELDGERGYQTAATTDDFGRFICVLKKAGIKALGLDIAFEDTVQLEVHAYALDFKQAKIEKLNNGEFELAIPCRKGLITRSAPAPIPIEALDSCALFRPVTHDRLGDHLPSDSIVLAVPSEESGRIVISALRDLVPEMGTRFRRGSVESR